MNMIKITAPQTMDCGAQEWSARFETERFPSLLRIRISSRSSIVVIVGIVKQDMLFDDSVSYYISSPNFGVAIPDIFSLQQSFWITEQLIHVGMAPADAVTVAQVLATIEDDGLT